MERPTKPCYVCGSSDWWLTPDGRWLCGKCHPNPNPDSNPELPATEEKYSSEVLALRARVILGNDKLYAAWLQIRKLYGEEREYQMARWGEAQEKLHLLNQELKFKGYTDCLYLDEKGKKIRSCLQPGDDIGGCRVCPSSREYWAEELMALPGPTSKTKQPEFVPGQTEFLEKLGGKSE